MSRWLLDNIRKGSLCNSALWVTYVRVLKALCLQWKYFGMQKLEINPPVSCVSKSVMCLVLKRPNNESGFKMEAL